MQNLELIFVVGPPGAGKGTLCNRLVERGGYVHLSAGDHLRALRDHPSKFTEGAFGGMSSEELRSKLQSRDLISAEQITAILKHRIDQLHQQGHRRKIIIDGFPRSHDAAAVFEREVAMPTKVIVFECLKEVAESRFLERKGEPGDDEAMFAKRYDEFLRNNEFIVGRYAELVKHVDASGEVDNVFRGLLEVIGDDDMKVYGIESTGDLGPS